MITATLRSIKRLYNHYSLFHLHPQDFDIEVEGTRELKLHVYSKSRLNFDEHCAQGKIEVSFAHACVLFACELFGCEHTPVRTRYGKAYAICRWLW